VIGSESLYQSSNLAEMTYRMEFLMHMLLLLTCWFRCLHSCM